MGDVVYTTTLVLWIATQVGAGRWAPLAVGALVVIESVVAILGGPLAGVFVDRWRKRALLVRTDVMRGLIVAVLVVVQLAGQGRAGVSLLLPLIYVLALAEECCTLFASPAELVLIGEIVPPSLRGNAMSLMRSATSAAVLLGPSLAAPLLFGVGVQWGLILNAASFAVSALLRRRISVAGEVRHSADQSRPDFRRELLEGLQEARDNRVLRAVIVMLAAIGLAAGAVNALMVFFVTANLHAPVRFYGVMGTAMAVGVLAGSLFAPALGRRLPARQTLWMVTLVDAVLLLVMSRMAALPPALAIGALFGVGEAVASVMIVPLLLDVVDPRLFGRVTGLMGTADGAARTISIFVAGTLASTLLAHLDVAVAGTHFRTYDTIFGVAALMVLATSLWARTHLAVSEPVPAVASA